MELKPAGATSVTDYEMEQVSQYTSQNSDPKEQIMAKELIASGPVSFARIYSTLNETLRRGGRYKNGAVVCHLDLNHADINEFITVPREVLPGLSDASTLPRIGGKRLRPKPKLIFFKASSRATSGSTK